MYNVVSCLVIQLRNIMANSNSGRGSYRDSNDNDHKPTDPEVLDRIKEEAEEIKQPRSDDQASSGSRSSGR